MATLEDLGRMAMVEVDGETQFPATASASSGWGTMALMLAAGAAVCSLVVGMNRPDARDDSSPARSR